MPTSEDSTLVKCLRCARTFIRGEYESHTCVPHYKGTRDIPVIQFWESKTPYNEPYVMAIGTDGYDYRLIQVKRRVGFVELGPTTDDSYHPEKDEGDDDKLPEPLGSLSEDLLVHDKANV